jgi:hypothetical protein
VSAPSFEIGDFDPAAGSGFEPAGGEESAS